MLTSQTLAIDQIIGHPTRHYMILALNDHYVHPFQLCP
jgi:hypothetical protein